MDFPKRLATLRNERGMTQGTLAQHVGIHVSQLRRYEAGSSSPTLDVLRKLAIALSVSSDTPALGGGCRANPRSVRAV
jgi:transcriptional regulator with XRE-family HTH domain